MNEEKNTVEADGWVVIGLMSGGDGLRTNDAHEERREGGLEENSESFVSIRVLDLYNILYIFHMNVTV